MISFGLVAATIFSVLAILVVLHFLPCLRELNEALRRGNPVASDFYPIARVILCLRGSDPFLDRCLRGLANQDYPNYKVLIVVDSSVDESLPQAKRILEEYGADRVEILIRDCTLPNCSRKVSSLFCGLNHVPSDVGVVAQCDADAIPHPTWLRELVEPMQDPMTVATCGNRWYSPIVLTMGGMCRYFWNALAFRAMHRYQIPWAGSLAMRSDLFRDPEFLKCLQHAFSEDTALASFLFNKMQHATPIVSLVMLNEESVGIKSFWGFLVRQILAARLHHPHWPAILVEALVIFFAMWILLPLSILQSETSLAWWCVGGFIYDLTVLIVIGYFEWQVRRLLLKRRQQIVPSFGWQRICLAPIGLTLTGFIYPIAVIFSLFTKRHEWRGIVYRIDSHGVTTVGERTDFTSPANEYESV